MTTEVHDCGLLGDLNGSPEMHDRSCTTKAPYRQQSLTASIVLLVLLVGTLLTDFFGVLG